VQDVYVPVLLRLQDVIQVKLCVDPTRRNCEAVAGKFDSVSVEGELRELLHSSAATDGVLIAHPSTLHAEAVIACLRSGRHVFCEKPLATNSTDCDAVQAVLPAAKATLCVNLFRRVDPSSVHVRQILAAGWLGPLKSLTAVEGGFGTWNSRSGFQFEQSTAGGGVTLDRGSHVLDLLIHWLGKPNLVAYRDDAQGGCEANSLSELSWPGGLRGTVLLSKSEAWEPSIKIKGENGELVWAFGKPLQVRLNQDSICPMFEADISGLGASPGYGLPEAFTTMLEHWLAAIRGRGGNPTPFAEVRQALDLIDQCYRLRQPLELPWTKFAGD